MRLISQDGMIDVPYEHGSLCQGFIKGEEQLIYTISYYNYSSQKGTKLAEYNSKDKALKVMEMVRNAYTGKNCGYHTEHGVCYHSRNDFETKVFYFPKDEEVEV